MDELAALTEQHDELAQLLSDLDDSDWQRPSRCDGWTVADVVLHLAQTDEMAISSASGRFAEALGELTSGLGPAASVDEGAARMVDRDRNQPVAAIHDRWLTSANELRRLLGAVDPHQRVTWVAGELSVRTLTTTRLAEAWIHTGDVAAAFGNTPTPLERLQHIARLAWRTVPYAFARAGRELRGPVRFELQGPNRQGWDFVPGAEPATVIRGEALDLCLVAGQRTKASETSLRGEGPDASAVLELVRTYA